MGRNDHKWPVGEPVHGPPPWTSRSAGRRLPRWSEALPGEPPCRPSEPGYDREAAGVRSADAEQGVIPALPSRLPSSKRPARSTIPPGEFPSTTSVRPLRTWRILVMTLTELVAASNCTEVGRRVTAPPALLLDEAVVGDVQRETGRRPCRTSVGRPGRGPSGHSWPRKAWRRRPSAGPSWRSSRRRYSPTACPPASESSARTPTAAPNATTASAG